VLMYDLRGHTSDVCVILTEHHYYDPVDQGVE
jgi:hypothetical protein